VDGKPRWQESASTGPIMQLVYSRIVELSQAAELRPGYARCAPQAKNDGLCCLDSGNSYIFCCRYLSMPGTSRFQISCTTKDGPLRHSGLRAWLCRVLRKPRGRGPANLAHGSAWPRYPVRYCRIVRTGCRSHLWTTWRDLRDPSRGLRCRPTCSAQVPHPR